MNRPLRLLPALALGLVAVFVLRAGEIWTGISSGKAWADDSKSANASPDAKPVTPVTQGALSQPSGEPTMDGGLPPLNSPKGAATATTTTAADAATPENTVVADAVPKAAAHPPIPGEDSFTSPAEIEVLESLTHRREELDKREAALDMREKLMATTEQRLDQKLAEVQKVEASIKASIHTLSDQEEAQIASLVKVYETMKPKDAAAILQGLERPILIDVAARMKEAKMSAILASMEPDKAREVTVLLAKRTRIPGLDLTGATSEPNADAQSVGAAAANEQPVPVPAPTQSAASGSKSLTGN
jgi:flagellar motility protein MotE (MotC chaperone)